MGLSLCYELRTHVGPAEARQLLEDLRTMALTLDCDDVREIIEWRADERVDPEDEEGAQWIKLFGTQWGQKTAADGSEHWIEIPPRHVLCFSVDPAEGSETAQFGLATHPAVIEANIGTQRQIIETGLTGIYSWAQCCKTQYAGLQQHGGAENFLKAHLTLVALLDHAQSLGIDVQVKDDSGYWEHRDRERLVSELTQWNGMIAAFAGQLKDRLGGDAGEIAGPIFSAPDFEHLEAKGLSEWSTPQSDDDDEQ